MKKIKFAWVFVVIVILCMSTTTAFGESRDTSKIEVNVKDASMVVEPLTDGFYSWEITSKGSNTTVYGGWSELCRKYTNGSSTSTISGTAIVTVKKFYSISFKFEKISTSDVT